MTVSVAQKKQAYWAVTIGITIFLSVYFTIYSLTHGIREVFPFLYFLPIILFVYFYPHRGVIFTLVISTVFLVLVYYFSNFNADLVAVSTAWFVIFVTIGVVTSSFAEGLRTEERKYREIFENSQAGIFTFELNTLRVKELNTKFAHMLRYERTDLTGKDLSRILVDPLNRDSFISRIRTHAQIGDIELFFHTRDGAVYQFLVSATRGPNDIVICSAIDITERRLAERVIMKAKDDLEQRVLERTEELLRANDTLRSEIRERKQFESAIQLVNRKLNTLSSITRHDILNQVTAIVMYLSLLEEEVTDPAVIDHLQKIDQVTQLIQKQIQFTRDYQNIGSGSPQWQNLSGTVKNAISDFDHSEVSMEVALNNLEIFADLQLEKVFHNLIDNSLRHGEKVTMIQLSYRKAPDGIIVCYTDNGVGIPAKLKERIFKREYYRNTGYGLFLASEIVSITGLTIQETGVPGYGAQFEIHVPHDSFRFLSLEDHS